MLFTARQRQRLEFLERLCAELAQKVEQHSNATVLSHIDDLRGAIDVLRASNRKEFSSVWGRLGGRPPREETAAPIAAQRVDDGSFEALLDLQSAPPAR